MKKPVSDKQPAANRANTAQPTSPRSVLSSRRYGFTAATFANVRLEEIDEVSRLREDAIAVYQPVNSQELFAIEFIALAQQAILRVARLHEGICATCLNAALSGDAKPLISITGSLVNGDHEITQTQKSNYLFAEGFHRLNKSSESFPVFLRYQAQTERLYRKAIEEFKRLKALRRELPNEPILEAQPELNETIYPSPETKPSKPDNPSPDPGCCQDPPLRSK